MIGVGPEHRRLESYAAELGVSDRVTFFGFVESTEGVLAHLRSADVFILPSEREGFPNTILEANACKTPCIVCDYEENGGTAVVEDETTGFISSPIPGELVDRITSLRTDPNLRARLGEGTQEFGKRHDWQSITKEMESVYRGVVDEQPLRNTTVTQP